MSESDADGLALIVLKRDFFGVYNYIVVIAIVGNSRP